MVKCVDEQESWNYSEHIIILFLYRTQTYFWLEKWQLLQRVKDQKD